MGLPRKGISLLRVVPQKGPTTGSVASSSHMDVPVSPAIGKAQPGAAVSIVTASAPTVRARSSALRGRNSEEGQSAIMQSEVILAAARRELDSARAILDILGGSIADYIAAVATARRHLGVGGPGDPGNDQEITEFFKSKFKQMLSHWRHFKLFGNV